MTKIDLENIDSILAKFFAGETSVSEEKALESFFCGDTKLPPEYDRYRDMFKWYASGMDESQLPKESSPAPNVKSWRKKPMLWWSSAAAAIAVVLAFSWSYTPTPQPKQSLYAETLVERNGKIIEGEDEIRADLDAAVISGYCLELEIDERIKMLEIN